MQAIHDPVCWHSQHCDLLELICGDWVGFAMKNLKEIVKPHLQAADIPAQ